MSSLFASLFCPLPYIQIYCNDNWKILKNCFILKKVFAGHWRTYLRYGCGSESSIYIIQKKTFFTCHIFEGGNIFLKSKSVSNLSPPIRIQICKTKRESSPAKNLTLIYNGDICLPFNSIFIVCITPNRPAGRYRTVWF